MRTIAKRTTVGIYDNCWQTARIYRDKIIITWPYVRWVGNTGSLDERKYAIRKQSVVDLVREYLDEKCQDYAWDLIVDYLAVNEDSWFR